MQHNDLDIGPMHLEKVVEPLVSDINCSVEYPTLRLNALLLIDPQLPFYYNKNLTFRLLVSRSVGNSVLYKEKLLSFIDCSDSDSLGEKLGKIVKTFENHTDYPMINGVDCSKLRDDTIKAIDNMTSQNENFKKDDVMKKFQEVAGKYSKRECDETWKEFGMLFLCDISDENGQAYGRKLADPLYTEFRKSGWHRNENLQDILHDMKNTSSSLLLSEGSFDGSFTEPSSPRPEMGFTSHDGRLSPKPKAKPHNKKHNKQNGDLPPL